MGRIDEPFPSKSRRRDSAELDVYKTKCSDLELTIVQLKLELAESKVSENGVRFHYLPPFCRS